MIRWSMTKDNYKKSGSMILFSISFSEVTDFGLFCWCKCNKQAWRVRAVR